MINIIPVGFEPDILPFKESESGREGFLFGYQIPYLPSFLMSNILMGDSQQEKLSEVFKIFEYFVVGLRRYRETAFSLRFQSFPQNQETKVFFIVRGFAKSKVQSKGKQVAIDIRNHLASAGIPYQAITSKDESRIDLSLVLNPFPEDNTSFVEIRQHERVVPMSIVGGEAYVIYPYSMASGSGIYPFETLLRQEDPVVINIYLEPTELFEDELESFYAAAAIAQTSADVEVPTLSKTAIKRRRDPGADLVGKIYKTYVDGLIEPFILTVQVASPNPKSAWAVARSYASTITANNYEVNEGGSGQSLTGADLVLISKEADQIIAENTFSKLIFDRAGKSMATPGKERMPYLVGARAATAAFRFPINSRGGVPGISVRQPPPDFDPGPNLLVSEDNEIYLGNLQKGTKYSIPIQSLTRHTFVTGFTGSGKTNTVIHILNQLWKDHNIPFLVIEAAKKEYRALKKVKGFEDLLIFSLGDETVSPFRLNPFELIEETRLEAHIGRLQSCFDAALPQFGILPSIVAEALEQIYKNRGWRLTDKLSDGNSKLFPTMRDMFREVIRVANQRGYAGETLNNIRAAAAGRIGGLLRGSKGKMFGGQKSFPADIIFNRPVILELNDLNADDKAIVMMFILTWLREYRESNKSKKLQHITVVEEAHNILSNVQSVGNSDVSSDSKAKAVEAFSNMLSEVRSYGEGIIISDQSPEKLSPDAIRNTNLQIAHQLRDRNDRDAISRAMLMDEVQADYLGKLGVGKAAIFNTGLENATFISVPENEELAELEQFPSDDEVEEFMSDFQNKYFTNSLPFSGCNYCGSPCKFREEIEPYTLDKEIHEEFTKSLKLFDINPEKEKWADNWKEVVKVCKKVSKKAEVSDEVDAAYCYLSHEIDFPFTKHMRSSFENAYKEIPKGG